MILRNIKNRTLSSDMGLLDATGRDTDAENDDNAAHILLIRPSIGRYLI